MYNEKVLNSVQTWLPGFSAMYHYTKFGMASFIAGFETISALNKTELFKLVSSEVAQNHRGKRSVTGQVQEGSVLHVNPTDHQEAPHHSFDRHPEYQLFPALRHQRRVAAVLF